MAYILNPMVWERIYPDNPNNLKAETIVGQYVIEKCLDADCSANTYKCFYIMKNGNKGWFGADDLFDAQSKVEANYKEVLESFMTETSLSGSPYTTTIEVADLGDAVENDTVVVVVDGVTYTATANVDGEFSNNGIVASGGDADENLSFYFYNTEFNVVNTETQSVITQYITTIAARETDEVVVNEIIVLTPTTY